MNEELKVIITAEIAKLKQGMEEAKKSVGSFKDQVKNHSADVNKNIQKMGDNIVKAGKAIAKGIAVAGAAIGAFAVQALNAKSDLEQGMGGSEAVFKDFSSEIQTAAKESASVCNLSAGEYLNYANKMGALFQGTGISIQQSSEMTQNYMQRAADVASIMGLTTAEAMEAVTGAAKGNFTMMDNLGVAMNETTLANYALEKGYEKTYQEMTQAEKEMVAYEMFMEKTEYAAGNCAKEHDTLAGSMELLKASWTNFISGAGDWSAVTDAVKNAKDVVVNNLKDMVKDWPELQDAIDDVSAAIDTVAAIVSDVFSFVINNWESIKNAIVAVTIVVGILTTAITAYNAVQAVKTAMNAAECASLGALITAQLASAAATAAALAPYLLIVAAIAAIIAIIVVCVKHWDEIKKAVSDAWDSIKDTVEKGVEKVKSFFSKIIDFVKSNWQGLLMLLVNPIAGGFKLAYDNCEGFRDKVDAFVNKVKEVFTNGFNAAKNTIINIFSSIKTGITEKLNAARDTVKSVIDKIKSFFKFEWSLPKLKMPHVKISGKFSLTPPSAPKFSIDWYAKGGVFDKPNLFGYGNGAIGGLGEAGAEAVVPLEKNTEWLDRIAERLANNNNMRPIILQVNGKTFAETSIDCLNDYTRQTGSLPLKIM